MITNKNEIRALAIQQPFAGLIAHTGLLVRSWNTPFRGTVLIGSTLKGIPDARQHCNATQAAYLEYLSLTDPLLQENNQALFLADLIDTTPLDAGRANKAQCLFKKNYWCFHFTNIREVNPFPFHGHHRTLRVLSTEAIDTLTLKLGEPMIKKPGIFRLAS